MSTSAPPNPDSSSPFALLDELLAQGIISAQEHATQCRVLALRLGLQHRVQLGRERSAIQPASNTFLSLPRTKESTMNAKEMLESMELNRRVMSEQLKALNGLAPLAMPAFQATQASADNSSATLLDSLCQHQMENAAHTLQALAGATARARNQWQTAQSAPVAPAPNAPVASRPEVIDVEVIAIQPGAQA